MTTTTLSHSSATMTCPSDQGLYKWLFVFSLMSIVAVFVDIWASYHELNFCPAIFNCAALAQYGQETIDPSHSLIVLFYYLTKVFTFVLLMVWSYRVNRTDNILQSQQRTENTSCWSLRKVYRYLLVWIVLTLLSFGIGEYVVSGLVDVLGTLLLVKLISDVHAQHIKHLLSLS